MSIKDSFSQALRDRLKKDNLVGPDLNGRPDTDTELSRYLRSDGAQGGAATATRPPEGYRSPEGYRGEPSAPEEAAGAEDEQDSGELTVISRNTIVEGNIRSFANMSVEGSVKGNIQLTKSIAVSGKVVGDISCANAVFSGASMQGNLLSKGQVRMDGDAMLIGDLTAQYADINGKIKGNLDISGRGEFKTDAVVIGDISVSTISVLDGATIQGYVTTTFLREENSKIFPEAIILGE